ncbi:hypothetical protein VaNZ11_011128, partial [Volvox africanus]
EIVATKIATMLQNLTKLVQEMPGEYVAGDDLSYGDIVVFVNLSSLISGILPGVPTDLLDGYPELRAFRNKIASIPSIKDYYEKHGGEEDGAHRAAFKPEAV